MRGPALYATGSTEWLQMPRSRLQLIRRPGRPGKAILEFMLVSSAGGRQQVSKLELDRHDDLLDVDLDSAPYRDG